MRGMLEDCPLCARCRHSSVEAIGTEADTSRRTSDGGNRCRAAVHSVAKRHPPLQPAFSSGPATSYRNRRSRGDPPWHPARSRNARADSGLRWRVTLRLSALRLAGAQPLSTSPWRRSAGSTAPRRPSSMEPGRGGYGRNFATPASSPQPRDFAVQPIASVGQPVFGAPVGSTYCWNQVFGAQTADAVALSKSSQFAPPCGLNTHTKRPGKSGLIKDEYKKPSGPFFSN